MATKMISLSAPQFTQASMLVLFLFIVPFHWVYGKRYEGRQDLGLAWNDFMLASKNVTLSREFPYMNCFEDASVKHGVPLPVLLAVARGESDFNPKARSHANAWGLMQILWPTTARELNIHRLSDLLDPCTNIDAGARYLSEMLRRYDGDLHLALAAYNYGPSRIRTGSKIPDGAEWYSGYIYRHLLYVVGDGLSGNTAIDSSGLDQKVELVTFHHFYRAEKFVEEVTSRSPHVRLDIFKTDLGRMKVYLLYQNDDEFKRSRRSLKLAGFVMN